MTAPSTHALYAPLFTTEAMRGIFSDRACLQGMLDFEAALARAQAETGVIPARCGEPIARCGVADVFDIESIAAAAVAAGNLAIPLVKALTARVHRDDPEAAGYVHWGATSQDAIDTGLVLQLRAAHAVLVRDLDALGEALAILAVNHRDTLIAGRTWLQHAVPTTFGAKVAGWLSAIDRDRARLASVKSRFAVVQFGGAAGTLATLGEAALPTATALARRLGLGLPDMPWHTQRDRVVEFATVLGLVTADLGKIARDIALLMQTEVGEVHEPSAPGRGGSSAMPHKRNPVGTTVAIAAALRAPGLVATVLSAMMQEHERGLGGWHAEWTVLPELCMLTAGALDRVLQVVRGLDVHVERMRSNADLTHGLLMTEAVALALARTLGKEAAHHLVERAAKESLRTGQTLRDTLASLPEIGGLLEPAELDRLLDPSLQTGLAATFVARVLAARERGPS